VTGWSSAKRCKDINDRYFQLSIGISKRISWQGAMQRGSRTFFCERVGLLDGVVGLVDVVTSDRNLKKK